MEYPKGLVNSTICPLPLIERDQELYWRKLFSASFNRRHWLYSNISILVGSALLPRRTRSWRMSSWCDSQTLCRSVRALLPILLSCSAHDKISCYLFLKEFSLLPPKLLQMPSSKMVSNWYCESFEDLLKFEGAPASLENIDAWVYECLPSYPRSV